MPTPEELLEQFMTSGGGGGGDTTLAGAFGIDIDPDTRYTAVKGKPGTRKRTLGSGWGARSYEVEEPDTGKVERTFLEGMTDLVKMDPEVLRAYQEQLYDAGFYPEVAYGKKGKTKIEFGVVDEATIKAHYAVLLRAYRSQGKLTPNDVINQSKGRGSELEEEGGGKPKPPPLTIQLTPPEDLLAVADATARKVLGRKLTDAELRSYVDAFHSMEAKAQESKYAATVGPYDEDSDSFRGPGGTITAPSDPQSFALSKLRQENPEDVRNQEMAHGFEVFHDLLRGNL